MTNSTEDNPIGETAPADRVCASTDEGLALQIRIAARRARLEDRLLELKDDTVDGAEAHARLKAKLSELSSIIKEGVVDGWVNLDLSVKLQLDQWLGN